MKFLYWDSNGVEDGTEHEFIILDSMSYELDWSLEVVEECVNVWCTAQSR